MTEPVASELMVKPDYIARSNDSINLIAVVGQADTDVLPFFLDHYRKLGAGGFVFAFHGNWDQAQLNKLDAEPDVHIWDVITEEFSDALRRSVLNFIARSFKDQWILHADTDEFLELPFPSLKRTIRALEVLGLDCLPAMTMQRITADGRLPELDPEIALDIQFPCLNINLAEEMGLEWPSQKTKFPLMRVTPAFKIRLGNHLPPNGQSVDHAPIRAVLHCYRWRKAIHHALEQPYGVGGNGHELEAHRTWLEHNGMRLPTEGARRLGREDLIRRGLLVAPGSHDLHMGTFIRKANEVIAGEHAKQDRVANQLRRAGSETGYTSASDRERALTDPKNMLLSPGRICLLTFEISPPYSGGTGSAVMVQAERLSAAGHEVHVIFGPYAGPSELQSFWYEYWESRGISLDYIPRRITGDDFYEEQFTFCKRLCDRVELLKPDLIHCVDAGGYGAHLAILMASGLAQTQATLIVTAHGSSVWCARGNIVRWSLDEAAQTFSHDTLLSLADVVCFPSLYMKDLVDTKDRGIKAPIILPNGIAGTTRSFGPGASEKLRRVDELVLFGRIEPRKGYDRFKTAIKALAQAGHRDFKVTLLGRFGDNTDLDDVIDLLEDPRLTTKLITNFSQVDAVNYLKSRDCLAIVPSRIDNLPYTVYECLENGIPVLASSTGGIPELVHPDDRSRILIADNHHALVDALADALSNGARSARLAFDPCIAEIEMLAIHAKLVDEARRAKKQHDITDDASDVVAIVYGSRIESEISFLLESLGKAVEEGEIGSARNVQLLDDPSDDLRCATAINHAAMAIDADYLIFCHASILPEPDAFRAMHRLIQAADFDAIVCDCKVGLAAQKTIAPSPLVAPGGPAVEAAQRNVFGAGFFLIKREAFIKIDGFSAELDTHELAHWELLNRLTACGGRVVGIPKALATLWIDHPAALVDLMDDHLAELLVRAWVRVAPPILEDLIRKASADFGQCPDLQGLINELNQLATYDKSEGAQEYLT